MPTQLVRSHGQSTTSGPATTKSKALVAAVPAGRNLVAWVVAKGQTTVSSISKPINEGAVWQRLTPAWPEGGSGPHLCIEIWIIKTTVEWANGYAVTATFPGSVGSPMVSLQEWIGLSTAASYAMRVGQTANPITVSAAAAAMLPGDVLAVMAGIDAGDDSTRRISSLGSSGTVAFVPGTTNPEWSYPSYPFDWRVTGAAAIIAVPGTYQASWESLYYINPYPPVVQTYSKVAVLAILRAENHAPTAPTLTTLASGEIVNRAQIQRAQWNFADPDPGDYQTAYDLRYRIIGAATWTSVYNPVGSQYHDFAGGSLADGDYEWQVRTYDYLGAVGPWSTSGFFTAATKPAGPVIVTPGNGATITLASANIQWSTPTQDIYQVRKVADNAGVPDPGTVYFDTGEVTDSTTRAMTLTFPVNDRAEHLQVRVEHDALWSDWESVRVLVSYTPPPAPSFTLAADPATASLLVQAHNPLSGPGQPEVTHNEVWVDDGSGAERRVAELEPNGSWRYWTPRSGRDYSTAISVVAVGSNGTTTSSL